MLTVRARPPFGVPNVPFPFGTVHVEERASEIDVGPLERDHLTSAQTSITAEQHGDQRRRAGTKRSGRASGSRSARNTRQTLRGFGTVDFFTRHVDVKFGLGGGTCDDSFHVKALVTLHGDASASTAGRSAMPSGCCVRRRE